MKAHIYQIVLLAWFGTIGLYAQYQPARIDGSLRYKSAYRSQVYSRPLTTYGQMGSSRVYQSAFANSPQNTHDPYRTVNSLRRHNRQRYATAWKVEYEASRVARRAAAGGGVSDIDDPGGWKDPFWVDPGGDDVDDPNDPSSWLDPFFGGDDDDDDIPDIEDPGTWIDPFMGEYVDVPVGNLPLCWMALLLMVYAISKRIIRTVNDKKK